MYQAVKEQGGWKISENGRIGETAFALFDKNTRASEQVTAALNAGKFHSRLEALKVWREAKAAAVGK
jgi:hypothetical protein